MRLKYTNTPLPLHVLDDSGLITAVSDRWLQLLGYGRDEVLGRCISQFQEGASHTHPPVNLDRLRAARELLDVPERYLRHDGVVIDVLASARVEHGSDGVVHILGGLADVTLLVRAEANLRESEQRARLPLAAVNSSGVWDWDTVHDLVYTDDALANAFGIDPVRAQTGAPLVDRT